jgi:hypothetical protein
MTVDILRRILMDDVNAYLDHESLSLACSLFPLAPYTPSSSGTGRVANAKPSELKRSKKLIPNRI